jgi:hypothetical protein
MPQLRYEAFSLAVLSVIHQLDVVYIQLVGQFAGIDATTLAAAFRGTFARIAHRFFPDVGFQQFIQPGRPGSLLKVTRESPRSPSMNCRGAVDIFNAG